MPLIGNQSVLNKSPGRFLNGGHAILRSAFNKPGMNNGRFTSLSKISAQPFGYQPGQGAWVLPVQGGGISSTNNASVTLDSAGSGSMGKAASGSASLTLALSGIGGLISSATGTASVTLSSSGGLFASKAAIGTASMSVAANGAIAATGKVQGVAAASLSASWVPYAIGWISGTTEESGLTPNGVAAAVWARGIEAGFSAEQILRFLAAHAAGDGADLEGPNPSFTGLDGSTVRIAGTYSGGTRTVTTRNGD